MNKTRRKLIQGATLVGGLLAGRTAASAQHEQHMQHGKAAKASGKVVPPTGPGGSFLPIETPDLPKLPWEMDKDVKVFHLIPEVVKREFLPGSTFDVWGFNGSMPGPTIEVMEGDRVRIVVENRLPEATSIHWHGLEVPIEMDGVMGLTQDAIEPGGAFTYEFTLHQNGTFFYHSHMPMQQMMGMIGLFIIHPKQAHEPRADKDFGLIVQEWAILPNNTIPNSLSMEFNWLTINGKVGPATTPLIVRRGERVRIRFVNLGMDHHPMHLHGNTFWVTGTEGMRIPPSAWIPGNTVLVGVAQARDVEFEASHAGDWMLHCHLPHHNMNHMVSMVGPMTHVGHGMHAGLGMEEGMGMLRQGHALAEDFGPSLGRAIGLGADREKRTTNVALQKPDAAGQHAQHGAHGKPQMVPGFPQDMHMAMDEQVAKPETYALRSGWSGAVVGMMTLVRVLAPDQYDKIKKLQAEGLKDSPSPPAHKHQGS